MDWSISGWGSSSVCIDLSKRLRHKGEEAGSAVPSALYLIERLFAQGRSLLQTLPDGTELEAVFGFKFQSSDFFGFFNLLLVGPDLAWLTISRLAYAVVLAILFGGAL